MYGRKVSKIRGLLSLLSLVGVLGITPILADAGTVWLGGDTSSYSNNTWVVCDNTSGSGVAYGMAETTNGLRRQNTSGHPYCNSWELPLNRHKVCQDKPLQPDPCSSWGY